jgi:hypothetical protein
MKKTSESQLKAQKRWDENNRERKTYNSKKATAKNFILKVADFEDLAIIEDWLQEAKNNLKK